MYEYFKKIKNSVFHYINVTNCERYTVCLIGWPDRWVRTLIHRTLRGGVNELTKSIHLYTKKAELYTHV